MRSDHHACELENRRFDWKALGELTEDRGRMTGWMERPEDKASALRRVRRQVLHPVDEGKALLVAMIDQHSRLDD